MKNFKLQIANCRWVLFVVALIGMVALFCWNAVAQEAGVENQSLVTSAATNGWLGPILNALTAKNGWLLAALTWMATLRIFFKPIMTAIEKAVKESASTKDDELLLEVEHSKGYVTFCWLLDLLASVKFGTQFTARPSMADASRSGSDGPSSQKGGGNANGITTALGMAFLVGVVFSGCASGGLLDRMGSAVSRPQVTVVTNTVATTVTNYVAVPVQVPGQATFVTNTVEKLTTNFVDRVQTVTNFVEREGIATGLQAAKTGSAIATAVAPPYGAMAATALGVVSAALSGLVAFKNKEAAQARNDAAAAQENAANIHDQLRAAVTGVEQFASAVDPAAGAKVKDSIAQASRAIGIADDLHATVQALTS